MRFFFSLPALLAALSLNGAVLGRRVLRIKDSGRPMGNPPLFALLGLEWVLSVGGLRYVRAPDRVPWLHQHFEALIACGIAFHTAALVTIFGRVLQI